MPYEPALDGLRALAILAVIGLHTAGLLGGWAGVDLFFVLSGFLITTITETKLATGRFRLSAFYFNRAVRLYPALLVMVAAILLNSIARNDGAHIRELAVNAVTYSMNWRRTWDTGALIPFDHTWSLAIEAQFYLIWPFFLMRVPACRKIPAAFALLALVNVWRWYLIGSGAPDYRTYNGFDTHCDSLLAGCILALWSRTRGRLTGAGMTGWWPLAALLVFFAFAGGQAPLVKWWGPTLATLVASIMLVAARSGGAVTRLLSVRPLVYIGQISYGIYLWQGAVLFWLHLVPPYGPTDVAVFAVATTVASITLASLSYALVERPIFAWRDRIRHPDRARGAAQAATAAA